MTGIRPNGAVDGSVYKPVYERGSLPIFGGAGIFRVPAHLGIGVKKSVQNWMGAKKERRRDSLAAAPSFDCVVSGSEWEAIGIGQSANAELKSVLEEIIASRG